MHDLTLSETNSRSLVALCSCGWQSAVLLPVGFEDAPFGTGYVDEEAKARATAEWRRHVRDEGHDG